MGTGLRKLFEPIEIRGRVIRNRIVQPGQGTGFGHLDGRISQRHLDFHRAKALGGVGLIIFEHTGIDRRGNVIPLTEPLIDDDRFVPRLRELTEMVHAHGARIVFQLGHGGSRGVYSPLFYLLARIPGVERLAVEGPRYLPAQYIRLFLKAWRVARRPKGPSTGPASWGFRKAGRFFEYVPKAKPDALTHAEIRELIRRHGEAARRVKAAGGDGVEVYCCHGYLLSQFFSPVLNERTDEYGGDVAGRARLTLEVIREVRRAVGDDLIISLRLNGADHVDGGSDVEAAKTVAALAEEAGADVINVTAGIYGSFPPIIPPMAEPHGSGVALAEAIKRAVRIPVIGGIRVVDPAHAETLVAEQRVDLVIMGRALLADPELPNKAREGRLAAVRKCIGCNQCLEVTEGAEGGIHCLVNPQLGREGRLPIRAAERRKRFAVVGGGPAGLTAAEVLAQRGHDVVLFEKRALGGRLRCMARVPGNGETTVFLDAIEASVRRLGVEIRQEEATEHDVARLGVEAVVVASGAEPVPPPRHANGGVDWVGMDEIFAGAPIGERVVVWGDDLYALSTGLFLAEAGKEVMIAASPRFFPLDPMELSGSALYLRVMLAERGVPIVSGAAVAKIEGCAVFTTGQSRPFEDVSTIVTCTLRKSPSLTARLRALGIPAYPIGDARWPRKSAAATCEAFELTATL